MHVTLVYASEFITIKVNQGMRYVETTWLQQPSSQEFREQLRRVIDFALANNSNKALFDIRQRAYLEIADQNWLMRDIVPLFAQHNIRFAYVISETTLAALDVFRIQSILETNPADNRIFKMKTFLSKAEALTWLLQ